MIAQKQQKGGAFSSSKTKTEKVKEAHFQAPPTTSVSYTHLRAHETRHDLVCRLLLSACLADVVFMYRLLSVMSLSSTGQAYLVSATTVGSEPVVFLFLLSPGLARPVFITGRKTAVVESS